MTRTIGPGTVAAITGGASGIGLAMAETFSARGATVAVADVNAARLDDAKARVPDLLAVTADMSDPEQAEAFAGAVIDRFGSVNVVCANAGIIGPGGPRLWEVPAAEWRRVVDVNLLGVVHTLRAFVPLLLRDPPGHVGITSSMAGVTTSSTMPAYFATKHALVSIGETLRLQLERDGCDVGVTVLLPARVTTNLPESLTGDIDASAGVTGFNPHELAPLEVAERFVEAAEADRLYAFTHPEAVERVRARTTAILEAFQEIAPA